jgi:hypothetical protein
MAEYLAESKKHLALDTDWGAALGMAGLFVVCALLAARDLFGIVRGTQPGLTITWQTFFVLALYIFYAYIAPDRRVRIACMVVAMGPISRVLLRILGAPVDTQLANAAFLRVINLMVFVGACVYVSWWFTSKVRYV